MSVTMSYQEKPSTRTTRIVVSGLLWVVGVPFLIVLWFWLGWWSLFFVVGSVWLTWDYIKQGSIVSADTVTRAGGWAGKPPSER